jgi:HEAT repeat protein
MTASRLGIYFVVLAALASTSGALGQGNDAEDSLPPAEKMLFDIWTEQLSDTARSAKTKREAAEGLLTRQYAQATEALSRFLGEKGNQAAQVAIAEAIARHNAGKADFVEPLMDMLTGQVASVRVPAARALATYKDNGIPDRLVEVALDVQRERDVRLAALIALQRMLDKRAVDALVQLLDDRDPAVAKAAEDALASLTNVRGMDRLEWKRWWRKNKNKNREEWLADLTESLAQAKVDLENENQMLRQKLVDSIRKHYAVVAPAQQDALLLSILRDPVSDVRLVGIDLVDRRVSENSNVSEELRGEIRALLTDPQTRVRQAAATAVAHLGDPNALEGVLARLKVEESSSVVQALLRAVGQLRSPQALPAVLNRIDSADEAISSAAASALSRMASAQPLPGDQRDQAVAALLSAYRKHADSHNSVATREGILTAMGALSDNRFIPIMTDALKDPLARVRRAAVMGLNNFQKPELAEKLQPHLSDEDHGVRQAAIVAVGRLGQARYVQAILRRTDPEVEPQAAVRQQAWDVAMEILSGADAQTLADALDQVADRDDSRDQRIGILSMLVDRYRKERSDKLPAAQYQLAQELLAADRPAEAAKHLADVYRGFASADSDQAPTVWKLWVQALLRANDPGGVEQLAAQQDAETFADGVKLLRGRIEQLREDKRHQAVMLLTQRALASLSGRLDEQAIQSLRGSLQQARSRQLAMDRELVAKLLLQLAGDESARRAGMGQLRSLGPRALQPLLRELRDAVSQDPPAAEREELILGVLADLAPNLTGYDPEAQVAKRLAVIDTWLQNL